MRALSTRAQLACDIDVVAAAAHRRRRHRLAIPARGRRDQHSATCGLECGQAAAAAATLAMALATPGCRGSRAWAAICSILARGLPLSADTHLAGGPAHSAKGPTVLSSTRVWDAMPSKLSCFWQKEGVNGHVKVPMRSERQPRLRTELNTPRTIQCHPPCLQGLPPAAARAPAPRRTAGPAQRAAPPAARGCGAPGATRGGSWGADGKRRRAAAASGPRPAPRDRASFPDLPSAPAACERPPDACLVVLRQVLRHQRPGEPRGACIATRTTS